MIWLHEVHRVQGRSEDAFERTVRDDWLPALARAADARLLYFLRHAHGTGASYRVVTLTALREPTAWAGLADAVDAGPLRSLAEKLDGLRHDVEGKILVPLPWSRDALPDWAAIPTEPQAHAAAVFMEDTVWPDPQQLERYVSAAGQHYAAEMDQRRREKRAILAIEGAFRTAFGTGRRREIVLWQRIEQPRALVPLVTNEVPEEFRRPGTWMHDALALRDQWESRLLRSATWSPLA